VKVNVSRRTQLHGINEIHIIWDIMQYSAFGKEVKKVNTS
jgi:hypothetical protein